MRTRGRPWLVDLAALVERFGWQRLFALAREKDLGFDPCYFLDALQAFDRLPADTFDLDPADYEHLRAKVRVWRQELGPTLNASEAANEPVD